MTELAGILDAAIDAMGLPRAIRATALERYKRAVDAMGHMRKMRPRHPRRDPFEVAEVVAIGAARDFAENNLERVV